MTRQGCAELRSRRAMRHMGGWVGSMGGTTPARCALSAAVDRVVLSSKKCMCAVCREISQDLFRGETETDNRYPDWRPGASVGRATTGTCLPCASV